jgi:hypothetical protein
MPRKIAMKKAGKIEKTDEEKAMSTPGFTSRISISILSFFSLVVFLVVWLFFFAGSFTIFQNIAVAIAAFVVFVAVMAAAWVSWGIRYAQKYGDGKCCEKTTGWDGNKKSVSCSGVKFHAASGCIYGLGFLGALFYYITTAPSFGAALLGVIKALLWPAFLVFGLLKSVGA